MEINIKNYLKKFEQFLPFESRVRNSVISAVSDVIGISLHRQKITVSGSIVHIQGSSALRNEIALKQAILLEKIKSYDPTITITKIY